MVLLCGGPKLLSGVTRIDQTFMNAGINFCHQWWIHLWVPGLIYTVSVETDAED